MKMTGRNRNMMKLVMMKIMKMIMVTIKHTPVLLQSLSNRRLAAIFAL